MGKIEKIKKFADWVVVRGGKSPDSLIYADGLFYAYATFNFQIN